MTALGQHLSSDRINSDRAQWAPTYPISCLYSFYTKKLFMSVHAVTLTDFSALVTSAIWLFVASINTFQVGTFSGSILPMCHVGSLILLPMLVTRVLEQKRPKSNQLEQKLSLEKLRFFNKD